MALKSYAQPAVFFHILMSFTDAAEAPKTRPPYLLAPLEWRKGATDPAHIPYKWASDSAHRVKQLPVMIAIRDCAVTLFKFTTKRRLCFGWKQKAIRTYHQLFTFSTNMNNIDERFPHRFIYIFALFSIIKCFMLFITFLYSMNIIILTFYNASTQLKQSLKLFLIEKWNIRIYYFQTAFFYNRPILFYTIYDISLNNL